MGNAAVAEELAGSDELDELLRLNATESGPEDDDEDDDYEDDEDDQDDDEDEGGEGIKPGEMPQG